MSFVIIISELSAEEDEQGRRRRRKWIVFRMRSLGDIVLWTDSDEIIKENLLIFSPEYGECVRGYGA